MKILIVEDELAISTLIRMNLTRAGYECICANDGEEALRFIDTTSFNLILLDIMLPKLNGYEVLEYLKPSSTPVIFISAKASVQDRVNGLQKGADDYLIKPFSIDELLARVESVLRRYHVSDHNIQILDIKIETNARRVVQRLQVIDLTNKEYELLMYLIRNKNIALYREVIYEKIWGNEAYDQTRTLDLHIQRLRKKLNWHQYIKTMYRIGYMLED